MSVELNSVPEAVDAIGRGEVVIVVDAEDRENEGDFICAAEKATPENINFMLSGRGQLCVSVLPCLLYTSPSPRDQRGSRMPSSA